MPWTGPSQGQLARFTTLLDDQRHDFQAIYEFLCDEGRVTDALNTFCNAIATSSFEAFSQSIAQMETSRGFSFEVVSPVGQLSPDVFLGYIAAGRPIDDIAFTGKQHGRSTHRVQWMMIAHWAEENQTLRLPVADLYRALGGPRAVAWGGGEKPFMAQVPPGATQYLWNDLVDSENYDMENATRPEFFNYEVIRTLEPGLYAAMG